MYFDSLLKAVLGSVWGDANVSHCLRMLLTSSTCPQGLQRLLVYASDALKGTIGQQNVNRVSAECLTMGQC